MDMIGHFLSVHPVLYHAAFIACAAIAAYAVVGWLCKEDEKLGELREQIGTAGTELAAAGFVVLPKFCLKISCAEYAAAIKLALTELAQFLKGPAQWIETELTTVTLNMAKTPTGLALLQKAVASVVQSTASATQSGAAATSTGSK